MASVYGCKPTGLVARVVTSGSYCDNVPFPGRSPLAARAREATRLWHLYSQVAQRRRSPHRTPCPWPGGQHRLLDGVLGVGEGSEHPYIQPVHLQAPAVAAALPLRTPRHPLPAPVRADISCPPSCAPSSLIHMALQPVYTNRPGPNWALAAPSSPVPPPCRGYASPTASDYPQRRHVPFLLPGVRGAMHELPRADPAADALPPDDVVDQVMNEIATAQPTLTTPHAACGAILTTPIKGATITIHDTIMKPSRNDGPRAAKRDGCFRRGTRALLCAPPASSVPRCSPARRRTERRSS